MLVDRRWLFRNTFSKFLPLSRFFFVSFFFRIFLFRYKHSWKGGFEWVFFDILQATENLKLQEKEEKNQKQK